MALALRLRDDMVPAMARLPQLSVAREPNPAVMARLQGKPVDEMNRRFAQGHRAYIGYWSGEPVSWGWVATSEADIGELRITFTIPEGERYLWNFVTLASHRGLGIYPRLLNEIVRAESAEAERFWIAYAPENRASGSGIRRAGFVTVAELSFDASGRPAVQVVSPDEVAAARMFGVPQATEVSACWKCAKAPIEKEKSCTTTTSSCCCDYQRPEVTCAA